MTLQNGCFEASWVKRFGSLIALALSVAACTSSSGISTTQPKSGFSLVTPFQVQKLPFLGTFGISGEDALARMRGNTIMTFDIFHGAQYEYMAADGTSYLWYGNNERTLRGTYFVRGEGIRTEICWNYGPGTYNPVTRQSGTKPDCSVLSQYLSQVKEMARGDVLKLSSGEVPLRGIGSNVSFVLVWNKIRGNPRFAQ